MAETAKPTLIYDGNCGFCTACVDWLRPRLQEQVALLPWQAVHLPTYGLSPEQANRTVWWVVQGQSYAGHRAVAKALRAARNPWPLLGAPLEYFPISWLAAVGYWLVARSRSFLPGVIPACKRPEWRNSCGRADAPTVDSTTAAPPDAGGHQGAFTQPADVLQRRMPHDGEVPKSPPLAEDA